jgi:hypothetical protein
MTPMADRLERAEVYRTVRDVALARIVADPTAT